MPKAKPTSKPQPAPKKSLATGSAQMMKETYDQLWKQTEEYWGQLTRNPNFLAVMSTAIEQSQNFSSKVQELVTVTLRTMNLPTRDDYQTLLRRIDTLIDQVAELNEKLDELAPAPAPAPKPAPKPAAKSAPKKTRKTTKSTES